jgi:hypothetical protein
MLFTILCVIGALAVTTSAQMNTAWYSTTVQGGQGDPSFHSFNLALFLFWSWN